MYKQLLVSIAVFTCLSILQLQSVRAENYTGSSSELLERGRLADLVRLIIDHHPRVTSAGASLQASSARYQAANQPLYNPELELDTERTDINTTSLGLSQTIDWNDKREARVRSAGHDRNVAVAAVEVARLGLATELLKALSDYHTADAINLLGQQRLQIMQQFASIADQRYQAGDLNQVDLELAKLAALEATLESTEIAARLSDAETTLRGLFSNLPVPKSWPGMPQSLPVIGETDIESLLRSHPAFKVRQAQVETSRAIIVERQRETRPDPTISLRAGREDDDMLTGLTLSVPLFVRNTFQAEVTEANALVTQAEFDARATWLALQSQLNASIQRYSLTRTSWNTWQKTGETSLKQRVELLERLWQIGELRTTDYLVQLKQTLDTQTAAAELRGRLWLSWSNWLTASGTVFQWLGIEISGS